MSYLWCMLSSGTATNSWAQRKIDTRFSAGNNISNHFIRSDVYQLGFHFNFHLLRHFLSLVTVNTILFHCFTKVSYFVVAMPMPSLVCNWFGFLNCNFYSSWITHTLLEIWIINFRCFTANTCQNWNLCGGWFLISYSNRNEMQWKYTNDLYCAMKRKRHNAQPDTKYKVNAIFYAPVEILYTIFSGYADLISCFRCFRDGDILPCTVHTHNKLEKFDLC